MQLSPKVYTWLCGAFAALGSILFGYDLGIIASVLPAQSFLDYLGPRASDPTQQGLITSLFLLGAFFGCVPSGIASDAFGRRKAIIMGCVAYWLGGGLQTGATSVNMLMSGRFFAGFGVGMLAMLAPLYQAEIAHPSIRGRLTTLQQFFLGIGAFVASWVGYGCFTGLHTNAQWRLPLGLQILPSVPLAVFIMFFPESPRWLMSKGRDQEGLATLARLHARGDIHDPFVQAEFKDIQASIKHENEHSKGWSDLLMNKSTFRRLMLGVILQFSVQMTGVSALQYYSPQIFAQIGIPANTALLLQAINSILALISEFFCVMFVDKLGRRWPLIVCNLGCSMTFLIGTIIIAKYPAEANNTGAHWGFIITTWVFNIFFSLAIGPLSWAYPAEIFNTATRAKGTSLTSSAAWIANFMIAQVTPKAMAAVSWRFWLLFCLCGATNALTIWALFPETKGRRLEEMDALFESSWFVPTANIKTVDGRRVEEELRQQQLNQNDFDEKSGSGGSDGKGEAELVEPKA